VSMMEAMKMTESMLLWGLIATAALTTILQGSQGLGLSRLSLPFILGTFFTGNRSLAGVLGFVVYVLGGWAFAFLYYVVFAEVGFSAWWLGALLGILHSLFLLIAILPLLPGFHPRMATERDGPTAIRRLEPPGFMGLNYGRETPLSTVLGHAVYGAILGAFYPG
jgi:uncharacterized membrane protein YagU involved in acid resistance